MLSATIVGTAPWSDTEARAEALESCFAMSMFPESEEETEELEVTGVEGVDYRVHNGERIPIRYNSFEGVAAGLSSEFRTG